MHAVKMAGGKSKGPQQSYFSVVEQFETDYAPSTITKYISAASGMSVVVVDKETPKVLGFFALATEIHDDSGAPHTLEHICFMGSKEYPYRGVLDKIATRAYSGTNAWTDTDNTTYTLETAGWKGFAQVLPIYLDHVLRPTITDEACTTEVHHIDGNGADAGVVYSEMQAIQNTSNFLENLELSRLMYPEQVGFRYETGGMMEQLRVLTPQRIRQFHKEMYQPRNMTLIIVGTINHTELLELLEGFEKKILPDLPSQGTKWKRPWIDSPSVPLMRSSIIRSVEFPEQDESTGEILVGWLGPDCNDALSQNALEILQLYLASSSASLLEREIVEVEDPLASAVYFYVQQRPNSTICVSLSSVATSRLEEVENVLFDLLHKAATDPINFSYMQDCVSRAKRQLMYSAETGLMYFTTPLLSDFLYGPRGRPSLDHIRTLENLDVLQKWRDDDWRSFIRKWLADAPHVSILGKPSAKLAGKLKEDEKSRLEKQIQDLGPEGLERLKNELERAKKANTELPPGLLKSFKIPPVDSITFIKTTTARAGLARSEWKTNDPVQQYIDSKPGELPVYLHFENIRSNFVAISILLSTSCIETEYRPYVPLFLENFFNTPISIDGKRVEFDAAVALLEKDTVEYEISSARNFDRRECIRLKLQVEVTKYRSAIDWIRRYMWDSIFDEKRLLVTTKKLNSDIPDEKRSGDDMSYSVCDMIRYSKESLGRAENTLVKSIFLKKVLRDLRTNPEKVIKIMEHIRSKLFSPLNMRIFVLGETERLKDPVAIWKSFFEGKNLVGKLAMLDKRIDRLTDAGRAPGKKAYIVPMPTVEGSYSIHVARGVDSMSHPDLPSVILACSYLDAVEGPLWRAIRGPGLAYGSGFSRSIETGHLVFTIYRSPNAWNAFVAAKAVVEDHINGKTKFDNDMLEGALSSIVVSFADNEANMFGAAASSVLNQVIYEQPKNFNMILLQKVEKVTVEDLKAILKKIFLPLFQPETSITVVTSQSGKSEDILRGFNSAGFNMISRPLNSFEDGYGYNVSADDDESGEDDADEDENDAMESMHDCL